MESKNVLIGNKLIAEFIGMPETNIENHFGTVESEWCLNSTIPFAVPYDNAMFDESWDWLMPVVEKIEEMDVVASFQIEQPTIYIWASSESSTFEDIEVDTFAKSKIEAVYESCIKFIKWYNENKDK